MGYMSNPAVNAGRDATHVTYLTREAGGVYAASTREAPVGRGTSNRARITGERSGVNSACLNAEGVLGARAGNVGGRDADPVPF